MGQVILLKIKVYKRIEESSHDLLEKLFNFLIPVSMYSRSSQKNKSSASNGESSIRATAVCFADSISSTVASIDFVTRILSPCTVFPVSHKFRETSPVSSMCTNPL